MSLGFNNWCGGCKSLQNSHFDVLVLCSTLQCMALDQQALYDSYQAQATISVSDPALCMLSKKLQCIASLPVCVARLANLLYSLCRQ